MRLLSVIAARQAVTPLGRALGGTHASDGPAAWDDELKERREERRTGRGGAGCGATIDAGKGAGPGIDAGSASPRKGSAEEIWEVSRKVAALRGAARRGPRGRCLAELALGRREESVDPQAMGGREGGDEATAARFGEQDSGQEACVVHPTPPGVRAHGRA